MINAQSVWLDGTLHVGGGKIQGELGWRGAARLYSFRPGVDSAWTMTDTPTYRFALAVHNSELLLVGGRDFATQEKTKKVFMMKDGEFKLSDISPMTESRVSASAISNRSALVVAGGCDAFSSIEVFKDGQWTTAPSLPSAGYYIRSALHGDLWYIIQQNKYVFCVSLQLLISGVDTSPWKTLPKTLNNDSAVAFFGDRLLSIGGGEYGKPTTAIYALSSNYQSWEHVADLPVPLSDPMAVVSPDNKLIVGGCGDGVTQLFCSTIRGKFYI